MTSRYSTSRRKACDQCCKAKVRCITGARGCTRCSRRGEKCQYVSSVPARSSKPRSSREEASQKPCDAVIVTPSELTISQCATWLDGTGPNISNNDQLAFSLLTHSLTDHLKDASTSRHAWSPQSHESSDYVSRMVDDKTFSFDHVESELVCPINADDIQNRWLSSYIPAPDQKTKEYPTNVVKFMSRMLKSYVASAIHGRALPPFVHSSQLTNPNTCLPLTTCLSMIRLLARSLPGSRDIAVSTIQQEMRKLYPVNEQSSGIAILATYQAYLIYTMALHFSIENLPNSFLRQAMIAIQELACASAHQGLVCLAEQQSTRPTWEAWIVSEAKRRTLYVMCMFDSILLSHEGLPNYLSIELKGLPAPSSKTLWQSQSRMEWQRAYNIHLAEWPDENLRIDELWPLPPDLDESGINERSHRIDRWLEGLDEFGTMLFAVTGCTHGS